MKQQSVHPRPSWGRVLGFALGGGVLGATTSGLMTTFMFTVIYPGGLRAMGVQMIPIYLVTMSVGGTCGAANAAARVLWGKSVWGILFAEDSPPNRPGSDEPP